MDLFYVLFFLSSVIAQDLLDGEPVEVLLEENTSTVYRFPIATLLPFGNLVISLTRYSDSADPVIYVKQGSEPSEYNYSWSNVGWSDRVLNIPEAELAESDLYILLESSEACRCFLFVEYKNPVNLPPGVELVSEVDEDLTSVFYFEVPDSETRAEISLSVKNGHASLEVSPGIDFSNSLPVSDLWSGGQYFEDQIASAGYYARVTAENNAKYGILGTFGNETSIDLKASSVLSGTVEHGKMVYYKFNVDSTYKDLTIWVSTFSGNVQLYIKALGKPTLAGYDTAYLNTDDPTLVITSEMRKDFGAVTGEYFIGVFGTKHSSYTITAFMNEKALISVADDLPMFGRVKRGEMKNYYLNVQKQRENLEISIYLNPIGMSDPDLFVKLCWEMTEELCEFTMEEIEEPYDYAVRYSGSNSVVDSILFEHKSSFCLEDVSCNYIIGVRGMSYGTTSFTLTVSQDISKEYVLRNGYPMYMSVPSDSYQYYKYTVQNHTASKVEFLFSLVSGSGDLYVSRSEIPSEYSYEKKSNDELFSSKNVTYILGDDGTTLVGTYHVAVYSYDSSSFSLFAQEHTSHTNSTIKMSPGQPQRDTLYNTVEGNYKIYQFTVNFEEGKEEDIKISLSPVSGRFSLLVTNDIDNIDWEKERFRWFWKDASDSGDPENFITIGSDDAHYIRSSTYAIFVNATEFGSDDSATYSIVYYTPNVTITLTEDLPYRDQVPEGEYRYYVFPIQSNHKDFKVTVTATSGDPDLYVSLNSTNTRPSSSEYDFAADYTGSDILTVTWEGTLNALCPELTDEYSHGNKTYCEAYIAVKGYSASYYSIRVHQSASTPSHLILGHPHSGSLEPSEYDFYYLMAANNQDLFIDLQPTRGLSRMFVSVLDEEVAGNYIDDWVFPLENTADFVTDLNTDLGSILAPFETLEDKCPSGGCAILVSIFCPETSCGFLLSASQDPTSTLVENEPKKGFVVKDQYTYYMYYCGVPDNDLVITVTSLNGADPDLFVTKGRMSTPTKEEYQWSANTYGNDSILITPDDDSFYEDQPIVGTYVIGVYGGDSEITTYMISVNNHPTAINKLIPGTPYTYSQGKNSNAYYYFFNDLRSDIVISLTPQTGSANFTITESLDAWESLGKMYSNLPTPTNYTWTNTEDKSIIRISQLDPDFCVDCELLIGVFTSDADCKYSITAKNDLMKQVLQNGIPVKAKILENQAVYYSYELTAVSSFDVVLNSYSGDSDVYVKSDYESDPIGFIWHSETDLLVDHIRIYEQDPNHSLGTYTIKVSGYKDSTVSILAHDRDSHIALIDGWPLFYSLEADPNDRVFFRFSGEKEGNIIYCNLFPGNYFFRPIIYRTFERLGSSDITNPGPDNYEQVYNYTDYDNFYGRLRMKIPKSAERGEYVFGVYSYFINGTVTNPQHSYNDLPGSFEIKCTSSDEISIMAVNTFALESIPNGVSSKRFEVSLPEDGHFEVQISPCVGIVELMISKEWASITGEELEVETSNMSNGMLIGTLLNASKGTYYITVKKLYAEDPEAVSFEIKTIFAPMGQNLPIQVSPGNQGVLNFEEEVNEKIKVSWEPIPDTTNPVLYSLVVTNDTSTKLDTFCGVTSAIESGTAHVAAYGYSMLSAETSYDPNEDIVINVYAMVNDTDIEYLVYNSMCLKLREELTGEEPSINWTLMAVLAGVLTFAFLLAVYLYCRCKRLQKDLEYELGDMRNNSGRGESAGFGPSRPQNFAPLSQQMDQ